MILSIYNTAVDKQLKAGEMKPRSIKNTVIFYNNPPLYGSTT